MAISETVLILAGGTAVLSIVFGIRVAMRAVAGGAAAVPRSDVGEAAGGSGAPDVAEVIALPPLIFLGFLAAAAVLEAVVPLPVLAAHALPRYLAGAVIAACGFVIIFGAAWRFRAAGTNIPPSLPSTALVVDGIYRRTREPNVSGNDPRLPGPGRRGGKSLGDRARRPAAVGDQYQRHRAGRALSGAEVRRCVSRLQGAGAAAVALMGP